MPRNNSEATTSEQEILHYLFEDVARLPIITNRTQELWLGIQLRAFTKFEGLIKTPPQKQNTGSVSPNSSITNRTFTKKPKGNLAQQRQMRASRDLAPIVSTRPSTDKIGTSSGDPRQVGVLSPDRQPDLSADTAPTEDSDRSQDLLLKVIESFSTSISQLIDDITETYWLSSITIHEWARELLIARRDIYNLHRSRLRRTLDEIGRGAGQPEVDQVFQAVCETVEHLALLPDELLMYLGQTSAQTALDSKELSDQLLPELDDVAYMAWVKERTNEAKQQLVLGYLRYALRIARNYVSYDLDFPDLVQHAFLGLLRSADRFDYRINARFGTYATSWIWQSVTRALIDEGALIRLPAHIHERLNKLSRIIAIRDTGLADPLSDPELLVEAGFLDEADLHVINSSRVDNDETLARLRKVERQVRRLVLLTRATLSIDEVEEIDSGLEGVDSYASLHDRLASEPIDDFDSIRPVVNQLLALLTDRQREVVELRFGLNDGRERTLGEIGTTTGVTRERIRQIEHKAMLRLEEYLLFNKHPLVGRDVLLKQVAWNIPQLKLPAVHPVELFDVTASSTDAEYDWLLSLFADLPHSSWHAPQPRSTGFASTRVEQLVGALVNIGAPAHYTRIIETVNEVVDTRNSLDEATGYNILTTNERAFLLLGQGVFSLVEWEQARAREQRPILPICPLALPDPPGFEDVLFESIFVGREFLQREPTAAEFLDSMLRWAEADPTIKPWLRQGILSTYYLTGLIPYTFIYAGDNPRLRSALPDADVNVIRRYCLQTMTERLAVMPEFWWVLGTAQPARPADVGEQLAALHPDGLDDALQRFYLLSSLGAAIRLPGGYYRLTPLGEACAAEWGRSPEDDTDSIVEVDVGFGSDLLDWGLW